VVAPGPKGLHIGIDAQKVVVSPVPLKMRTGRARRVRGGSVTEVVPVPPSGRSREERVRFVSQLVLVLVVLSAVLGALGIAWWAAAGGSFALVAFVAVEQARAARTGLIALPKGDGAHVLHAPEERAAFERALVVAKRVRRTWPALRHMIDPDDADRGLTAALRELAAIMARRQQIRRLRDELAQATRHDLPADSPAVQALAEQRLRVEALWRSTAGAANRILASINAAALAGENLIREQRLGETARQAEVAISRMTAAGPPRTEAGPELAERTAAVIAAYRELASGR
jgi:DNA-directed RNA polymerase subunit K/omega